MLGNGSDKGLLRRQGKDSFRFIKVTGLNRFPAFLFDSSRILDKTINIPENFPVFY